MSMAGGVVLFVIGAILAFAVHVENAFIDLRTVGLILMAGGVVVFLIGLALTIRGNRSTTTSRDAMGERVTRTTTATRDDV